MLEWILGAAAIVEGLIILFLVRQNTRLWLDREAARRALAVEHMAAQNLVEAVRRGEGEAAVKGWEQKGED